MSDMPIAEQLVLLAELASVDGKHKSISDKLETVPAAAKKADETAASLKKQLDDLALKKEAADKAKKQIENEIVDEKLKIKKWEARAHEIRGEREHAALLSEISTAKRVIHRLEDTQLEHMEVIESVQKDSATIEGKHKKAADEAAAEWKRVEGDLKALNGEAEQVKQARQALLEKLPPRVVKRYDTVAAKRQGVGVSVIKGEVCSMCKRTLPPQLCIQVRKGVVLEECPSCSRLLVHEDMTKAPSSVGAGNA
jgi:predicted  nucleic acid-binding Zn-ribbon protein